MEETESIVTSVPVETFSIDDTSEVITTEKYIDYSGQLSTINYNIICGNICLFILCCMAIIVIIYKWIQSLF